MINNMKGFTLIETLIAVLLLATALTGPLTIASKGLTATLVAKDQFTAFYLAQDAMEQVRFLRDSACLSAGPQIVSGGCPVDIWLSNLTSCTDANGCYLDSLAQQPTTPQVCPSGICPTMSYDSTNKIFNYNFSYSSTVAKTPQQFVRKVRITPSGTDEAVVTVTVTWSDIAGVTHAPITVRENIFRWQ